MSAAGETGLTEIIEDARGRMGLITLGGDLSALRIFRNNVRVIALVYMGGLVSFGVLGIAAFLLNIGLIGGVLGIFALIGYSPGLLFAAGVLPHGMFELPALMLASAAILRTGAVLVTPQTGKSMGQILLEQLAESVKVILGLAVPLLLVASLVEAYVTPQILRSVLP
jgi:stage II sporulation protein M